MFDLFVYKYFSHTVVASIMVGVNQTDSGQLKPLSSPADHNKVPWKNLFILSCQKLGIYHSYIHSIDPRDTNNQSM